MDSGPSTPLLKIFFAVEPGPLEVQAHLLIASLTLNCRDRFVLTAFCRVERIGGLQAETRAFLERNDVSLMPIVNDFADGYPAGNKLIAAGGISGADWYLFLDTDMVMMRPASILAAAGPGQAALCLDTLNGWSAKPDQWAMLFGTFGQPVPAEIISYPIGLAAPPIYNAGLVLFPGNGPSDAPDGPHFGQQWLEAARTLDRLPTLEAKRPWLDTIALLPALASFSPLGPTRLDRDWNNTTRLATDEAIIVHYHGLRQIKQYGWLDRVDAVLRASASPFDSLFALAHHYKRDLGVAGDVFRRAMRHGLQTQNTPGGES